VGYSLVPNLELAQRFGCRIDPSGVVVDEHQATSVANVYAAGEVCGIKGALGALAEGICAGAAACGTPPPESARRMRVRERLFAEHLATAFALRRELSQLPDANTIVCRCEDVPYEAIRHFADWNTAKLQTRCGMGLCQGRVCGAATQHLLGWGPQAVRPPLIPIPIGALMKDFLTEGTIQ
jgi:NADPH-dependent 2,4-dienoyl-CoA reductase/sulfur reductase-like enzyme